MASADISVIVPVYNVAKYLRQCLDSICAQTHENIEIICIDDGSADPSGDILDEYANKDARIRTVHKRNSGYGATMNLGLSMSRGKYVQIVESDDFIEADMCRRLLGLIEKHGAEVVKTNYYQYDEERGNVYKGLFDSVPKKEIILPEYDQLITPKDSPGLLHGYIFLWNSLYLREYLEKNRIRFNETPGASYQDVGFTYKVYMTVRRMVLNDYAGYHYRVDNADSSVNSSDKVFCVCDEFDEIWRYYKANEDKIDMDKRIIPSAQFRRYGETRCRISGEHYWAFRDRMLFDFDILEQRGCIEEEYWSPEAWGDYQGEVRRYSSHIRNEQLLKMILEPDASKDGVLIFGAGKVAEQVYRFLSDTDIVKGYIVSEAEENPRHLHALPVHGLRDADDSLKSHTVLTCVKDADQAGVVRELRVHGFRNILMMTRCMREMMG